MNTKDYIPILFIFFGLCGSAGADNLSKGLSSIQGMVHTLREVREYIARVEDDGTGAERHFQTGTLSQGAHWSAQIRALKETINIVDVPEPDLGGSVSVGDVMRASALSQRLVE
jgi:hypothetical protein